jgi:UDP-N-acetylmuramoyl-L-alanyl-D-glutamate--2,6-diaminopimelate ligase
LITIEAITDNTKEWEQFPYFLKTFQNEKYITQAITSTMITPQELVKELALDEVKIIGITGTNGKTTTAAAIYSFLLDLGYKVALQGTRGLFINDERVEDKSLTTPSIFNTLEHLVQAKKHGCAYFVMEVSSHAIVQQRIEGLDFDLKILTNITSDHLDFHGSVEEYVQVKNSFFADESRKLINKDQKNAEFNYKNAYTYSIDNGGSFTLQAYSLNDGISMAVEHFREVTAVHSSMHGLFNVSNLLAAVSAVKLLTDRDMEEIAEVVGDFAGVSGRMEVVSEKPLIVVDFAHTHDGMEQVMDSFKTKDMVVVFGAGGDRDRSKRALMGAVASKFAKRLYITSDNPRSEQPEDIIEDILEGVDTEKETYAVVDRKKAISHAIRHLQEGEILLVLGKGDETYQEIAGKKLPFDDREVIREIVDTVLPSET